MTFDEVLDEMNANQETSESIRFMEQLRDIYAPTVEMTSDQKENLLMMKDDKFSFIEIVAEFEDDELINNFDSYWKPLTEIQLMQAWLHPEIIKIIKGK